MRARPGERTMQIVALWQSGELARLASQMTQPEAARRLGMSTASLYSALGQARAAGYQVPTWQVLATQVESIASHNAANDAAFGCEWDDEPTLPRGQNPLHSAPSGEGSIRPQPNYRPETRPPSAGMHTASVMYEHPSASLSSASKSGTPRTVVVSARGSTECASTPTLISSTRPVQGKEKRPAFINSSQNFIDLGASPGPHEGADEHTNVADSGSARHLPAPKWLTSPPRRLVGSRDAPDSSDRKGHANDIFVGHPDDYLSDTDVALPLDQSGQPRSTQFGCSETHVGHGGNGHRTSQVDTQPANGNDMLPAHGPGVRRSTLIRDGEPVLQWIKNPGGEVDPQAVIDQVVAALADTARAELIEPPQYADEDILNVVPIGDAHIGMLAWAPEAGENFDLEIAEHDLMTAARRLASRARPARHALIVNVGDFTHADGPSGLTTKGTKLDMDGRWPRVIGTSIRLGRQLIDLFLRTHEIVDVKWARGNHDETAALVIAIALAQFYEHEPRVRIDTSPEFYHWHRFGLNLIGVHHSEKAKKPADLFGVMAVDRAKDWGETKHRRFYCGHLHHSIVKEERTVVCEWVPTLAASDAWHRGQGYRACRELRLDTFHARLGMIDRHIVGIDEVRQLQAEAS